MSDEPKPNGVFDARKLGLPALSIVGLIVAISVAVWQVSGERNRIDNQFGALRQDISGLNVNLEDLTSKLVARTAERWTRTDMATWCFKFRLLNPKIICPDPFDQSVVIPEPLPAATKKTNKLQSRE